MSQALQFWERDEQQEKKHAFCVMKKTQEGTDVQKGAFCCQP